MRVYNNLWNHDDGQQLGEGDVLVLTLNWGRGYASANWYRGRRKPIAGLLAGNHVGWIVEFIDDAPFVSQAGRQFLVADSDIAAALDDIARSPSFERMEFVRRRIAAFGQMTIPTDDGQSQRHTCATVVTSFDLDDDRLLESEAAA